MLLVVCLCGFFDLLVLQFVFDDLQVCYEFLWIIFELDGVVVVQCVYFVGGQVLIWVDLLLLIVVDCVVVVDVCCVVLSQCVFDLQIGFLFEMQLLCEDVELYVLLVNMYYIIFDGWLMGVLIGELSCLYVVYVSGVMVVLDLLLVQYVDYVYWQQDQMGFDQVWCYFVYWCECFVDVLFLLDLLGDYFCFVIKSFQVVMLFFDLDVFMVDVVVVLVCCCFVMFFMVLFVVFEVLLGVYSGCSDIFVVIFVVNWGCLELVGVIGFFVNIVLFCDVIDMVFSFIQLLEQVWYGMLQVYVYQELLFDQVVDVLNLVWSIVYVFLVQVLFVVQNVFGGDFVLGGLVIELIEIGCEGSDFDLVLELQLQIVGYCVIFMYSMDFYQVVMMCIFGVQYGVLLSVLVCVLEVLVVGMIVVVLFLWLLLLEGVVVDVIMVVVLQV